MCLMFGETAQGNPQMRVIRLNVHSRKTCSFRFWGPVHVSFWLPSTLICVFFHHHCRRHHRYIDQNTKKSPMRRFWSCFDFLLFCLHRCRLILKQRFWAPNLKLFFGRLPSEHLEILEAIHFLLESLIGKWGSLGPVPVTLFLCCFVLPLHGTELEGRTCFRTKHTPRVVRAKERHRAQAFGLALISTNIRLLVSRHATGASTAPDCAKTLCFYPIVVSCFGKGSNSGIAT